MPVPEAVPDSVWEVAENKEMEEVVVLYGKVFHLWQTDRGDELPLGMPQLMVSGFRFVSMGVSGVGFDDGGLLTTATQTSFTSDDQLPAEKLRDRDVRFGVSSERKKAGREYIEEPEIHPDADAAWKK
jgi:hypothetical protein